MAESDVRQMPAISLAFVGDGIYDLYIRARLVDKHPRANSNYLNRLKVKCVKADAQAAIAHVLMPQLDDEELAVLKRGRNVKSATVPKNAKLSDYKYATGFETLLGYLFLLDRHERLKQIMDMAYVYCQSTEVAGDE